MNVRELIEQLAAFDPELEVMVHGYEGGAQSLRPESLYLKQVRKTQNADWYFGDHRFEKDGEKSVLIISRLHGERGGTPEN